MEQARSTRRTILTLYVAAMLVGACVATAAAAPIYPQQATPPQFVNYANRVTAHVDSVDRLIVKYKDVSPDSNGSPELPSITSDRLAQLQRSVQKLGLRIKAHHTIATGGHVLKLPWRLRVDQMRALARLIEYLDPNVEYAEPDRLMQAFFMPNDPFYSEQWSYYESAAGIRLPAAWDGSTGTGVTVAVLDTGYLPHAELAGQILPGYDFISDTEISNDGDGRDADASDPGDAMLAGDCGLNEPAQDQLASWHGTHVAGNIASLSNNSIGIAGVAFNAKILPARVLGKCGGYTSDIADAIIWASGGVVRGVPPNQNNARVLNLSLGDSGECDRTTQAAIDSARSRGAVIVVAAGNENRDVSNSSPANCQGVIAVAAVDRSGARARYSNFGAAVSVAAPGGDISASVANGILSTLNAGLVAPSADSYAFYQGTSMAAPQVAGVVALMLSKNPNLSPDDVASRLMSSASPFPTNCPGCGAGIVNAAAALDAAAPSAPVVPASVGNANQ